MVANDANAGSPHAGSPHAGSPHAGSPHAADPFVGRTIGPARLERKLGQGGMGMVYLGLHVALGIPVAVKMLPPVLARDDTLKQRFLREAKAIASLNHPHLLRVYDFGSYGDGLYLVMEYVDGGSITDLMTRRGGKLSIDESVRLARETASALEAVHRAGIVHRDIKPENLLVGTDGQLKVADFGLAHQQGSQTLSATGMILGSPAFMSPEQASGKPVDERSDVFSLGVTLYAMLTGGSPFSRTHPMACLLAVLEDAIPAIEPKVAGIPAGLAALVRAMLEREPERRVPSMHAVSIALAGDLSDPGLVTALIPTVLGGATAPTAPLPTPLTGRGAGKGVGKAVGSGAQPAARRGSAVGLPRPRSGSSLSAGPGPRRGAPPTLAIAGVAGAVALLGLIAIFTGAFTQDGDGGTTDPLLPPVMAKGSGSGSGSGSAGSPGKGSQVALGSAVAPAAQLAKVLDDLRADVTRACADRQFDRAIAQIDSARDAAPPEWDRELGPKLDALAVEVTDKAKAALEDDIAREVQPLRTQGKLAEAVVAAEALATWEIAPTEARRAALVKSLREEQAALDKARMDTEAARAQARQRELDLAWEPVRAARAGGRIEEACAAFEVVRADDGLRELRTRPDAREMEELIFVSETWRAQVARQISAGKPPVFRHPTLGELRLLEVRAGAAVASVVPTTGASPRPRDLPLDEIPADARRTWVTDALAKSAAGWETDPQWCLRLGMFCLEARDLAAARQWLDRAAAEDARPYLARLAALEQTAIKPVGADAPTPELDEEALKALLKQLGEAVPLEKVDVLDRPRLKVRLACKLRSPGSIPDYAFEPDHRPPGEDYDEVRSALRWASVESGGAVEIINGYLHVHLPVFAEVHQIDIELSSVDSITGRTGYAVAMVGTRGLQIGPIGAGQKIRLSGTSSLRAVEAVADAAPTAVARPKKLAVKFEDLKRGWIVEGKPSFEEDDFDVPTADHVAIGARDLRLVVRRIAVTGILAPDRIALHAKRKLALSKVIALADKKAKTTVPIFTGRDPSGYASRRADAGWQVEGRTLVNDEQWANLTMDVEADFLVYASYLQEPFLPTFQTPTLRLVNEVDYWLPVPVGGGGRHDLRIYRYQGVTHALFDGVPLAPRLGTVADQYRPAEVATRQIVLATIGARFRIGELGYVPLADLAVADK